MNKKNIWYKVIVINIDIFESQIIYERHFGSVADIDLFIKSINNDNTYYMIVPMMENIV